MDNDIRVVTDKEVYLLASPAVSKSETEIVFRNWLRTGGLTGPDITDAINIVRSEDIYVPMSVTSVESWGNWSLLQGTFQKREFDRDQRQYERDYLVYQTEEKKHHAAKERGESYTLPAMPRAPSREDYFEFFPESGEYTTSFKGILRGFGAEDLGRANLLLNDLAAALDQLLRKGFPAAAPVADAPAPINRNVLNTLVDDYVSDRGIDWVKDQAKKYEKAKKLEISGVNYRRECNIVFLPVRVIEYSYGGKTYIAASDPIRNEYMLGTPPAVAKAVATPPPAAKSKTGLIAGAGAAAVVLVVLGVLMLTHSGKHPSTSTAAVPAATPAQPSSTPPAATSTNDQAAAQQAAAEQAAAQQATQAAAEKAAADAAAAKAAQEAAAEQAAQDAAAAQAAQEAAAAQAAQEAADQKAAQDAAAAKAAQQEAADKAAQQAAVLKAAQDAAAAQAAKDAAAAQAAQDAAATQAAQQAQEAAAAKAAQQAANAQAAQSAASAAPNASPAALDDNANDLTAAANASPAAPAQPAANAKSSTKAVAAAKPQPAPPPAVNPQGLTGKDYEAFAAGKLRLPDGSTAAGSGNAQAAAVMSTAAADHDAKTLSKTTAQSAAGNDLGYYYLGVAAQDAGNTDAARTYYQLSLQHSQTNSPPSVCSPRHRDTYQPQICHGIVLPSRAARALASLPSG